MRFTVCRAATLLQDETRLKRLRRKVAMVTLTYRDVDAWKPGHVAQFIDAVQAYAVRRFGHRLPIIWVAELQKRGAVHYHLAVWLPVGSTLPKPDARGWWSHGSTRIEWAKFAPGYLAKYVSKADTKDGRFPKGCRMHSNSGLPKSIKDQLRFEKLPEWVKDDAGATLAHDVHRTPGGFVARATGEVTQTPWIVRGFGSAPFRVVLERDNSRLTSFGPVVENLPHEIQSQA